MSSSKISTLINPLNRRSFIQSVSTIGAGLSLAISLPSVEANDAKEEGGDREVFQPNAFLRIAPNNEVLIYIKHLEMGQGTFTGLSTLVAEELEADWQQIKAEASAADPEKYKNLFWGMQGTGGSSSIANSFTQMRYAGATAKQMLLQAAAKLWKVDQKELMAEGGFVKHPAKQKQVSFGQLAELAATLPVPPQESIQLKDPKDFKLIGKRSTTRKDVGKTNGTAVFTQDVELPGMLVSMVAHAPRFGGKVKSYNAKKALSVKGVKAVNQISSGIAVIATDYWTAKKARDLLTIEWDDTEAYKGNSHSLMDELKNKAQEPGLSAARRGDFESEIKKATKVVEATYEFPYLAHASMEPMNCVALISKDKTDATQCELWYGSQIQTLDQGSVAKLLKVSPNQVKINTVFAGGSFGRRANPHSDYVLEAAEIATHHKGTPIKLIWSREDDTAAGFFRPMYAHKIKAGVDDAGNIIAWQQRIAGQSILEGTAFSSLMVKDGIDATSVEGASNLPYSIPNFSVGLHTVSVPVPVQWWRSVGHTHTAYSTETMMDELASAAKQDPIEFRMKLLKEHPRHMGVLKLVAEKSQWQKSLPENWYRGVAVHESFSSYVAQVVEISMSGEGAEKSYKIERVVCAVDCGLAINPDIIEAQLEGGIGYGLSPALMSKITLEDGVVKEQNFDQYQVLRMNGMPKIEVHILPSSEAPTGIGEPGTPPIAPALANALSAATGKRYYQLPLKI